MSQKVKSLLYLACFIASAIFYEVVTSPEDPPHEAETAEVIRMDAHRSSPRSRLFEDLRKR